MVLVTLPLRSRKKRAEAMMKGDGRGGDRGVRRTVEFGDGTPAKGVKAV